MVTRFISILRSTVSPLFLVTATLVLLCARSVASDNQQPRLVIDAGGTTRIVKNVIFTRDGRQLVSIGDDKVVRVWDVRSGKTVRTIRTPSSICTECITSTIALSPDEKYLAIGGTSPAADLQSRYAIRIYDFLTGQPVQLLKGHRARVISLAFSADSKQLASGSTYFGEKGVTDESSIRVWALRSSWENSNRLVGHKDAVSTLTFSPDGASLVSGSHDNELRLWPVRDEFPVVEVLKKQHSAEVYGVSYSPNGQFIVSGGLDGRINLWDGRGVFVKQLSQQKRGITSLVFSPDNNDLRIAAGLEDGTSLIISIPEGVVINSIKRFDDSVWACAFSPDGKIVATTGGYNGEILLWPEGAVQNRKGFLSGNGQTVWSVGFANDGNSIAFGNQHVSVIPNKYGPLQHVVQLRQPSPKPGSQTPYRISFAGDLNDASAYRTALTKVGDLELKTRVGELRTRRFGSETIQEPIPSDRELQILRGGSLLTTIRRTSDEGRSHCSYTFTNDGRYVISGGERGYVAIYDVTAKPGPSGHQPLHQFIGHTNDVWSLAVSPDDQFLVSGSSDQTVRLWDIKSGRNILSIFVGRDREWVAWTPAGYYTSSPFGDKYFGWQLNPANSESPQFFTAAQFAREYYRPDVIAEYFRAPDIQLALAIANERRPHYVSFDPGQNTTEQKTPVAVESILPPTVVIAEPAKDGVVTERLLRVKLLAKSSTMPITEVRVALNGVPKGAFKGDIKSAEESKKMEIEMVVALAEGENKLYVVAANANAISNPAERRIIYKPQPELTKNEQRPSVNLLNNFRFERAGFFENRGGSPTAAAFNECMSRPTPTPTPDATPTPTPTPTPAPASAPAGDQSLILVVQAPREQQTVVQSENLTVNVQGFSRQRQRIELKIAVNADPPIGINRDAFVGTMEMQVTLRRGDNVLSFTVSDGQTTLPAQIRRVRYEPRTAEKPNLIFLGIGISKYQVYQPELRFADKDAKDLGTLLCAQAGGRLYDKVKVNLISDQEASRTKILEGLRWLNQETKYDNDIRVVLIAGHGGIIGDVYYFYSHFRSQEGDPEEDSIRWQIFWDKLKRQNSNAFLFVDTCHSGGASRDFVGDVDGTGVLFFPSSKANETSAEDPNFGNGVFTHVLLKALRGDADTNRDNYVDSSELERFIEDNVPKLNGSQNPQVISPGSLQNPIRLVAYPTVPPPER